MFCTETKFRVFILAVVLAVTVVAAKSIDTTDQESFRKNQIEMANGMGEDAPIDAELFKYLLTKELLSRRLSPFDWDERQRKRSYWKQCAFNAVSCFGKK